MEAPNLLPGPLGFDERKHGHSRHGISLEEGPKHLWARLIFYYCSEFMHAWVCVCMGAHVYVCL